MTHVQRLSFGFIGLAAALLLPMSSSLADAIDGNWCHDDGRRMTIRGPQIVTPGGTQMQGNYSRHAFDYAVPASEPGAGQTIFMQLLNENTVRLQQGSTDASMASQLWHRCAPSIS